MVRYKLVDIAVLVSFRLRMADQDYHLCLSVIARTQYKLQAHTRGLPMLNCDGISRSIGGVYRLKYCAEYESIGTEGQAEYRRESARDNVSSGSCDFAGRQVQMVCSARCSAPAPASPPKKFPPPARVILHHRLVTNVFHLPHHHHRTILPPLSTSRAIHKTVCHIAPFCHEPVQTCRAAVAATPSQLPPCLSQSPSRYPPLPTLAPSDRPRSALSHPAMRMPHPSRRSSPNLTAT